MSGWGWRAAPANGAAAGSPARTAWAAALERQGARRRAGQSQKGAWLRRRAGGGPREAMWPVLWATMRAYAPYVTFPVAFVVGAVGYHLEWLIRGQPPPQPPEEEKSISERREDRKLQEIAERDLTQVVSLKDKLEFAPKAVLNRNRPEKN